MYWRKQPRPLAGFPGKLSPVLAVDRNVGRRDVLALFQDYVSGGGRNPALRQGLDPVTPALCLEPAEKSPCLPFKTAVILGVFLATRPDQNLAEKVYIYVSISLLLWKILAICQSSLWNSHGPITNFSKQHVSSIPR